jgi:hypothetical protein
VAVAHSATASLVAAAETAVAAVAVAAVEVADPAKSHVLEAPLEIARTIRVLDIVEAGRLHEVAADHCRHMSWDSHPANSVEAGLEEGIVEGSVGILCCRSTGGPAGRDSACSSLGQVLGNPLAHREADESRPYHAAVENSNMLA